MSDGRHPRDRFITIYGRKPVLELLGQPDRQVARVLLDLPLAHLDRPFDGAQCFEHGPQFHPLVRGVGIEAVGPCSVGHHPSPTSGARIPSAGAVRVHADVHHVWDPTRARLCP